ncbi:hypothetical protein JCM18899A_45380 [Nocardioides sp. AN3]
MTHQVALTISGKVPRSRCGELEALLEAMAKDPGGNRVVPFSRLPHAHFARVVLLEPTPGSSEATLLMTLDCDASVTERLEELARIAGTGLDDLLGFCDDYPASPDHSSRLAFLRSHLRRSTVFYVHAVGRTLPQVRDEARLRGALETFLDQGGETLARLTPVQVRDALRVHVAEDPDLAWALVPAAPPALGWRLREALHKVAVPALLVVTLPVGLPAALVWLAALRWHERVDAFPEIEPDPDELRRLGDQEDFAVQNAFTSRAPIRPGRFWSLTSRLTERVGDYCARHLFTTGSLSGLTTVHFARFMRLDDDQVLFTSYYDGSLESYNNDFVDQVAWVLNTVFGQQAGFPRTRWMVRDGAHNERWFKNFIRGHQVPTQVWYSAYPDLAAVTIDQNARLRAGLSADLGGKELDAWLSML